MKKEQNSLHQKLDSLVAPINKEQLWAKIHTHEDFPKKKDNRRRFFLLFLGFFALGSVGLSYFYSSKNLTLDTFIVQPKANLLWQENQIETRSNHLLTEQVPIKNAPINKETKKEILAQDETSVTAKSSSKSIVSANKNTRSIPTQKSIQAITSNSKSIPQNDAIDLNPSNDLNQINTSIIETNTPTVINNIAPRPAQASWVSPFLTAKEVDSLTVPLPSFSNKNIPQLQQKENSKKRWSIALAAGSGYSFHHLSGTIASPDNKPISLDLRKENTQTIESYLFELKISRLLKKKWELGLGLQYALNYQKFNYTFIDDIVYKRDPNPDEGFFIKNANQITHNYYHKYRFIDLNLSLSRRLDFNRSHLTFSTGLGLNMNFQVSGKIVDSFNKDENLNSNGEYKKTLQPFYFGALTFSRDISPSLSIFTGIKASSKIKLTQNDLSFKHTIVPIYGNIGIAFKF